MHWNARDELGINEITQARPLQAALSSGASFTFGGILPFLVAIFGSLPEMEFLQYISAIVFLAFLGALAAKTSGSSIKKAVLRITFWGTVAMGLTALIGYAFGENLS